MRALLLLSGLALAFLAPAVRADEIQTAIQHLVAEPVHSFQTVEIDPAKHLRWAAWDEAAGPGPSAGLAVFRGTTEVWSKTISDSSEPTLRVLPDWHWNNQSIIAVTLRQGADAVNVTLYGLDATGQPVNLGGHTGSDSGWFIDPRSHLLLVLYDNKHPPKVIPYCYEWDATSAKLAGAPCHISEPAISSGH